MKRVLLAGATGYLGRYIAQELQARKSGVRAIVRNLEKARRIGIGNVEMVQAQVTDSDSLSRVCEGIDVVISTIGITRQKDGLTYMDVDYQANLNLLQQALQSGVKKFIYVSVLNGEALRHLRICEAKERFADRLRRSGIAYCIVRPNGFFSDMAEFYTMARKGRIYLFGDGSQRANPIHGSDLAAVCVAAIDRPEPEINVGGPQTLTHNAMAQAAFKACGTRQKVTYIPDWIRQGVLKLARIFFGSKTYGPLEFFMTVMAMDMLAPEYGTLTLADFYQSLHEQDR